MHSRDEFHNKILYTVTVVIKSEALLTIGYTNFSHVTIVYVDNT
jgi:hypothetical protein